MSTTTTVLKSQAEPSHTGPEPGAASQPARAQVRTAPGLVPFRAGPVNGLIRWRLLIVGVLGIVAIAGITALALTLGDYPIGIPQVLAVVTGGGESMDRTVILQWRAGRLAAGVAVGFCLGMAGAITQTMARNSLVSPDVLGITHGASCAAVLAFVFTGAGGRTGTLATHIRELLGISTLACIGALVTALAVVLISRMGRGGSIVQVVLIGIGISMLLSAATTWALAAGDTDQAQGAKLWVTGSLNGRDWQQAWPTIIAGAVIAGGIGWLAHQFAAQSLGQITARVLGVNVQLAELLQLTCAVFLTAFAVSAGGPIGFVAFLAPQLARRLGGSPTPPLFVSGIVGAAVVATADLVARVMLPWEVPVGIVTALVGAPVLLYLVLRDTPGKA